MSSHQLAIAKASFSAGLLRPDPIPISRDEIAYFHTLLNSLVIECSPANIQNCKRWILRNIVQSTARCLALGKYLTALSTSFTESAGSSTSKPPSREPSAKRKRLHLLYLFHDLLHHAKYHNGDVTVAGKVQPSLEGLFSSAASFRRSPKQWKKIQGLLDIWEEKDYYSPVYIDRLRGVVKSAPESLAEVHRNEEAAAGPKSLKLTPFTMPAMHGDQGVPWYDLPAGNLLPHIIPNSIRPINPALVKPLRFTPGPVDEPLVQAVKDLLRDVDKIFDTWQARPQAEEALWDIDELGQVLVRDEITGEMVGGDGYYGWSKGFCERMKRYGNGLAHRAGARQGESEDISRSRSLSRSSSRSHRVKRRRYTDSGEDRGRSRSRSRTRFGRQSSYSVSPSPPRGRGPAYERESQLRSTRRSTPDSRTRSKGSRDATELLYQSRSPSRQSSPDGKGGEGRRNNGADPYEASYSYDRDVQAVPPASTNLVPPAGNYGRGVIAVPPPPPHQGAWTPAAVPTYVQHGQAGGVWPPPPAYPQGAQPWQSTSYGQSHLGSHPWTPGAPHERNEGGAASRGRGWTSGSQQAHASDGSAYNGHRGGGRGRGRGW